MPDRIRTSNVEDWIKGKMLDAAVDQREHYTRIFYYGQVISNVDPKNSGRIKVRVPFLDDNLYKNKTKDQGDDLLPWCSPVSRNFISQPENNSIVLIAVLDPKTPYWGRIYFDGIASMSAQSLFDSSRLIPETDTYNNWDNAEAQHNVYINTRPDQDNAYSTKNNINYLMGIKGKGKNKIVLDDKSIYLVQNENDNAKQSLMSFTENVKIQAADKLDLLSTKGNQTHYHPVFDQPLYDYLTEMNNMIKSIVTVMNTTPSLSSGNMTPNLPSPEAIQLIGKLANMYVKFNQFKLPGKGASKQININ